MTHNNLKEDSRFFLQKKIEARLRLNARYRTWRAPQLPHKTHTGNGDCTIVPFSATASWGASLFYSSLYLDTSEGSEGFRLVFWINERTWWLITFCIPIAGMDCTCAHLDADYDFSIGTGTFRVFGTEAKGMQLCYREIKSRKAMASSF